jgi:putative sugar O-methyltransferase
MARYPELQRAFSLLSSQSDLYKPTSFWDEASKRIAAEIEHRGIEDFRRLPLPLSYFVPTYGPPTLGINQEQAQWLSARFLDYQPSSQKAQLALDAYLSGYLNALADYRVLVAANPDPDDFGLTEFSESGVGNPIEQFSFEGKTYSRSSLNYLLGLSLLKRHVDLSQIKTVLEIGGGFGTLGEILGKAPRKHVKYIDVDIPPTQFVAEYYLKKVFGSHRVRSYQHFEGKENIEIKSLPDFTVVCSWQLEKIVGELDLFVNFISFQEMEPEVVANYLSQIKRLNVKWVLLRNMREGKQKVSADQAGVKTPVTGDDYLQMLEGYTTITRAAQPFGYETVDGFHSELLLLSRCG